MDIKKKLPIPWGFSSAHAQTVTFTGQLQKSWAGEVNYKEFLPPEEWCVFAGGGVPKSLNSLLQTNNKKDTEPQNVA